MRIALVSFHFAEYAYRLACALSRTDEVLLLMGTANSIQELGPNIPNPNPESLRIGLLPDRGLKNPLMLLNIAEIVGRISKFKPAVIHCQETYHDYLFGSLVILKQYALVLTIHDPIPHSGQDSAMRKRVLFYRRYLRDRPDAVIVHGERIAKECVELLPRLDRRIYSVPHGMLGKSAGEVTSDWETGTLLFFGRIEVYKGLKYLIAAVNLLRSENLLVKAIIAGKGSDLETNRQAVESHPAFELIESYIPNEQVPELFKRANAIVLPYTDATQSGVAALAQQYGRPTIATDVGSVGETVRHGHNGLIVPPRNVDALAAAIRRVVEDQEFARTLGKNAKVMAEGDLSWKAIAATTVNVYASAIQHKESISHRIRTN